MPNYQFLITNYFLLSGPCMSCLALNMNRYYYVNLIKFYAKMLNIVEFMGKLISYILRCNTLRGDMEGSKDRRSLDRLNVPSATAQVMDKKWFDIVSNYLSFVVPGKGTKDIIVKDISKSGACLNCEHRHECGDPVNMVVSIPGEKDIWIKGHVRWVEKLDGQYQYCIGIQFYAYGTGKKLNSMRTLEQLRNVQNVELKDLQVMIEPNP